MPVRDDDGRISNERSFLFAAGGTGFLWNEAGGVAGDWAIRVQIVPASPGSRDGGPRTPDGGALDAGIVDSMDGSASDGGIVTTGGGGCSCRIAPRADHVPSSIGFGLAALTVWLARRRARSW